MQQETKNTTGHEIPLEYFVDDLDLLELESRLGRFNIFDALRIDEAEIRHSNFLAFILDPTESHGHGQLFLKPLLVDLLKKTPLDLRPISPIDIDGVELERVSVRREWHKIDLLITCEIPSLEKSKTLSLVVAIENKIGSGEHSNQLSRYRQTIVQHHPKARPLYVFLTRDNEKASEREWISYGYQDIHQVLSRVRKTFDRAMSEDMQVFLEHYLNLIGTRFMNDDKIDELCQRIYKNHRQAIDLIHERVGSPALRLARELEAAIRSDPRWHVFYRSGPLVDFIPASWLQWMPHYGTDRKDCPESWFVFRFELYEKDRFLGFYAEVRRMDKHQDLRRQIVKMLLDTGSKYGFERKFKVHAREQSTRVITRERVYSWDDDTEADETKIREAVKKKLDSLFDKVKGLPQALQEVLGITATTEA